MTAWLIFAIGFAMGIVAGATACYLFIVAWANSPSPTQQEADWHPRIQGQRATHFVLDEQP